MPSNRETLPPGVVPSVVGSKEPQPKLPAQSRPDGSNPRPKPWPRMPPPVTGETTAPFVPLAGEPLGCNTMMQSVESGVPWTTLLVIHALPFRSNVRFPGPPKGHVSSPLTSGPEAFTLTARVNASRRFHLLFALGPNFSVR